MEFYRRWSATDIVLVIRVVENVDGFKGMGSVASLELYEGGCELEIKTVRGCGQVVTFDHFLDGPGMRLAREFSNNALIEFARYSARTFDAAGELPYAYRERQLTTWLTVAVAGFVDCVFPEMPTTRDGTSTSSHGWVDLWVSYRSANFLIEAKHDYSGVESDSVRKSTEKRWKDARNQLDALGSDACDLHRLSRGDNLLKCAMLFVTYYVSSRDTVQKKYSRDQEKILSRHEAHAMKLSPQANWSGVYFPREDMCSEWDRGVVNEVYPAISLFMSFDLVQKS